MKGGWARSPASKYENNGDLQRFSAIPLFFFRFRLNDNVLPGSDYLFVFNQSLKPRIMKIARIARPAFLSAALIVAAVAFNNAAAQTTRRDKIEDRIDRREDVRDRKEDRRDRREDIRDKREDVRDARHDGGRLDKLEDRRDRREDVRDKREDRRDRKEDRRDRRENRRDRKNG